MGNAIDVENRIQIFEGIKTGVIAEGTLGAEFVEVHMSFQHDFGGGRHFEIDGLALDQLDRLLTEKTCN